jgi:hypothetical protein
LLILNYLVNALAEILPPEVHLLIIKYTRATDIAALGITSKWFRSFLSSEEIWKQVFEEEIGGPI